FDIVVKRSAVTDAFQSDAGDRRPQLRQMRMGRAEIAVQMLRKVRTQGFRRQFWHRNQGIPSTPSHAIVTARAPICNIDCAATAICGMPDSPLVLENPEMLAQI